jgi:zeaxanthin epoxidase
VEKGLPVTRVISRMTLQQILARAVGPEIINNSCNVVDYEDDGSKVLSFSTRMSTVSLQA